MRKTALITGITGQDGAYLSEYLLSKGYIVHGIKRRASLFNTYRLNHLYQDRHEKNTRLFLHYGDLTDGSNLFRVITESKPDEVYNLAAMSHVHVSFEMPEYTANCVAIGTLRLLEIIKSLQNSKPIKFYQASTSELYGKVLETPQNEITRFNPQSPYAIAKQYAYHIVTNYREAYGLYAVNGILFNHESPMRGETFVTRKITIAVAKIALGLQKDLLLGNLSAKRDWGHAKDYVKAMYLMLQQEIPEDFVISTGVSNTVREFATMAFATIGIDICFEGQGINETGTINKINREQFKSIVKASPAHLHAGATVIKVVKEYFRPTEVENLLGNPEKANTALNWHPSCSLQSMIKEMVLSDIKLFSKHHNHEYVDGAIHEITNVQC